MNVLNLKPLGLININVVVILTVNIDDIRTKGKSLRFSIQSSIGNMIPTPELDISSNKRK